MKHTNVKIKVHDSIIKEGKTEGINQREVEIAMEMAKIKIKDEYIIKCTHISKKELARLKLQMTWV